VSALSRRHPARARVLDASRRLAARGESFTLAEVASEARVSRATVHRLFRNRQALLAEIDVYPEPDARERITRAAGDLITAHTLDSLSMDELADQAGVSRASLYRLFPGKAALFRELVRVYSPMEPVRKVLDSMPDRPPEEVMPAIARAAGQRLEGRVGLVRSLLYEVAGLGLDTVEGRDLAVQEAIGPVIAYIVRQMAVGRLRAMHPMLAVQAFVGPLLVHLLTRDVARQLLGYDEPLDSVLDELVTTWLRGMAPERGGMS